MVRISYLYLPFYSIDLIALQNKQYYYVHMGLYLVTTEWAAIKNCKVINDTHKDNLT